MFLGYIVLQLFCIYNLSCYFAREIDFVCYYYNSKNQIRMKLKWLV